MTQDAREELIDRVSELMAEDSSDLDAAIVDYVIANLPLVAKAAGAEVRTETREVCPLGDDPHSGPCAFVTEQRTVIETQWRKVNGS